MVSHFYVHDPNHTRLKWLHDHYFDKVPSDHPRRRELAHYGAMVTTLDHHVGELLDALDASDQRDNTLVVFTSDNGGHPNYAGNAPLRGSKWNLYEGGIRVPKMMRWPGVVAPGSSATPIVSTDFFATILAAAGEPDVKEKLLTGHRADGKAFKVHLDGYNLLPYLTGEAEECPRKEKYYFDDDGGLNAFRYARWKVHFKLQEHHGFESWRREYTTMRMPLVHAIRAAP